MKHLQNVLYVVTPDSYISKQGETICVHVDGQERLRVPVHTIESIVCFGATTISTPLIGFCSDRGIRLSLFSDSGRFYGRLEGPISGNVLLRRAQYSAAQTPSQASLIAWSIVVGKVINSRNVLLRWSREQSPGSDEVGRSIETMAKVIQELDLAMPVDTIRGLEGIAAQQYFGVLGHMVKGPGGDFQFDGRNRRPPRDRVNALLSFLYSMLVHDVKSALEGVGLDPQVGFLHAVRPGRPSLALDLAEELRAPLCDRLALSLINLKQIQAADYEIGLDEFRLSDDARKRVIKAWQQRKREEIVHPYLNERVAIGLIPHIQAQLLARHLRGDIDAYPPMHWR